MPVRACGSEQLDHVSVPELSSPLTIKLSAFVCAWFGGAILAIHGGRSDWAQPKYTRAYYKVQKGTSMEEWNASEVPVRASREPMSTRAMMPQLQEVDEEASYGSASESYDDGYGYGYYSDDSY